MLPGDPQYPDPSAISEPKPVSQQSVYTIEKDATPHTNVDSPPSVDTSKWHRTLRYKDGTIQIYRPGGWNHDKANPVANIDDTDQTHQVKAKL